MGDFIKFDGGELVFTCLACGHSETMERPGDMGGPANYQALFRREHLSCCLRMAASLARGAALTLALDHWRPSIVETLAQMSAALEDQAAYIEQTKTG